MVICKGRSFEYVKEPCPGKRAAGGFRENEAKYCGWILEIGAPGSSMDGWPILTRKV